MGTIMSGQSMAKLTDAGYSRLRSARADDAIGYTIAGSDYVVGGGARTFFGPRAFKSIDRLRETVTHEFIHLANKRGVEPSWWGKVWRKEHDLSFMGNAYNEIKNACR